MFDEATIEKVRNWWESLEAAGMGYSYGGKENTGGKATYCTEALIDCLNENNLLTPQESKIINEPFKSWGEHFPAGYENYSNTRRLRELFGDFRGPNPDELSDRLRILNVLDEVRRKI